MLGNRSSAGEQDALTSLILEVFRLNGALIAAGDDLVSDLGFDSLQVLELVAELEDRFDISIPLNDVPSTRTVAHIVAQVARLVGERSNA